MTRDEAREFAKVVQAYADGQDVQWREPDVDRPWCDDFEPDFDTNFQWRIKSEPREWWVVVSCHGNCLKTCKNRADAEASMKYMTAHGSCGPYTIARVREVTP
jgi:hypothetical protein